MQYIFRSGEVWDGVRGEKGAYIKKRKAKASQVGYTVHTGYLNCVSCLMTLVSCFSNFKEEVFFAGA